MKNSVIQFVLALLTIVIGAAAEDLLPKPFGVGFPILLASTLFFGSRMPLVGSVFFALSAGALVDSLSGLPYLTSVSFFLVCVLVSAMSRLSTLLLLIAYPIYQVWLCFWIVDLQGSVFMRFFISIPQSLITGVVISAILFFLERKAAVHEEA